jgi:hypothetical protein
MRERTVWKGRRALVLFAGALVLLAMTATTAAAFTVPPSAVPLKQVSFTPGPGTGPPPALLGGYFMTPFPLDPQGSPVTSVASPLGGLLQFGTPTAPQSLGHTTIGQGWATWSHGYTGDVYTNFTGGGPMAENDVDTTTVMTMPAFTKAFYFYAEPNFFAVYGIRAIGVGTDGSVVNSGFLPVNGASGARFYGFYSTTSADIARIVVTAKAAAGGFAVGEFGICCGD